LGVGLSRWQLDLTWQHQPGGQLILRWIETGGPPVQIPTRRGFGSRVIERLIDQVKGTAHFDWRPQGLVSEIVLKA
jgi:two-component sensor histidine kinase